MRPAGREDLHDTAGAMRADDNRPFAGGVRETNFNQVKKFSETKIFSQNALKF